MLQLPYSSDHQGNSVYSLWSEAREKQTSYSHLLLLHRFDLDTRFGKKKKKRKGEIENRKRIPLS